MKLKIGGRNRKKGYVHLDINPDLKPEYICDLTKGISEKDNVFDEILCKDVLEHIPPDKIDFVISEFWRILKHKGRLFIQIPYMTHPIYEKHFYHARYKYLFDYYELQKAFILRRRKLNLYRWYKLFEWFPNLPKMWRVYEYSFLRFILIGENLQLTLEVNKNVKFKHIH